MQMLEKTVAIAVRMAQHAKKKDFANYMKEENLKTHAESGNKYKTKNKDADKLKSSFMRFLHGGTT